MRFIYTSKEMSKSLGCALYIRCALSIEKYGSYILHIRKHIDSILQLFLHIILSPSSPVLAMELPAVTGLIQNSVLCYTVYFCATYFSQNKARLFSQTAYNRLQGLWSLSSGKSIFCIILSMSERTLSQSHTLHYKSPADCPSSETGSPKHQVGKSMAISSLHYFL
jgi:hypothetical protein